MSYAPAYWEDGLLVIRASGLGKCTRELWAYLQGIRPVAAPDWLEDAAAEGDLHEAEVKQRLREELGAEVVDEQLEVELEIVPGEVVIRGHLDGRTDHLADSGFHILEVKSMSKDQYKRWQAHGFGAFEHYAWQLSAYMHALGDETALYVVKDRNLGAREVSVQHLPPKSLADVKARALAIWSAAHRDMPPCDPQRYMCSMWFLHDEGAEEQDTRQAVGRHDQAIINELCREYDELGVKERAARALREKLRDQIKAAVGDLGRFSTGAYNVTVTKRKSTSYRWKDMVADGVVDEETLEKYRNPAYEMLRVSKTKEAE